jgi:hypothetical protein
MWRVTRIKALFLDVAGYMKKVISLDVAVT